MPYTHLFQCLQIFPGFDREVWTVLKPFLKIRSLSPLSICDTNRCSLFFLHTGILSLQDTQHNSIFHFIRNGEMVPDSYLSETLCYQALEHSMLVSVYEPDLAFVTRKFPRMQYTLRALLRQWIERTSLKGQLLSLPKNQRKQAFKKHFPELPSAVPQMIIARYLAMTPEYFSRTGW